MKYNELTKYYALDLAFSMIGFIFVCILFVYVKEMQQFFIFLVASYFGIKIIIAMNRMEKKRKKTGLRKYSKRKFHNKSFKKLSH